MDDLVRSIVEARGEWGAREPEVLLGSADLETDYRDRLLAVLVERAGGRVEFDRDEVKEAAARLMLVVYTSEHGLVLESRLTVE